jgi:DNA helicase-2/ATP-dependent DNA helicase PcrA
MPSKTPCGCWWRVSGCPPRISTALPNPRSSFSTPAPWIRPPTAKPPTPPAATARACYARLELSPYSLFSFLGLTLGYNQSELATTDKLAARVSQQIRQTNTLTAAIEVLQEIVGSERFMAVETEDTDSIYTRPGQVTIITMHKAKGLDWDVVFLPFLHEKTLPGELWVKPQTKFLGDAALSEVARAQIRAHAHQIHLAPSPDSPSTRIPDLITAWEQAKHLKTAEEYRLLYVAMTRAKRLLWISAAHQAPFIWSKPDSLENARPCPVLPAMQAWLRQHSNSQ